MTKQEIEAVKDMSHKMYKALVTKPLSEKHYRLFSSYKSNKDHHEKGRHRFIPMTSVNDMAIYLDRALKELLKDKSFYRPKAVDAGCGGGNIMFLMYLAGFKPYGLEIDLSAIKIAKQFFKAYDIDAIIERADILKHDYSKYDLVYFYLPLCNRDKEFEFELQVLRTLKVGKLVLGISDFFGIFHRESKINKGTNICKVIKRDRGHKSIVLFRKEREVTDKDIERIKKLYEEGC
jgi:SAM-dependent methyltransferase